MVKTARESGLAIGGGKMKKAEADKIARQIFKEWNAKDKEIIEKAEADGTWKSGLDTNRDLFRESDAEYKQKLKELAAQIDDEE